MRWFKRDMWKASIALASMLLLLVLMVWVPVSAAGAYRGTSGLATPVTGTVQATPTVDPTMTASRKEQLTQQVKQLQNWWLYWLYNGSTAFIAAFAAIAVASLGLYQWRGNRNQERQKEIAAQDKDLKDRQAERERRDEEQQRWLKDQEAEREKRAEERFQAVVEGLGSERMEAKVGAAITLRTFLQPGYERFYRQAFDLAVSHLRLRKAEISAPGPISSPTPILIVPKGDLRQEQQPPPTASISLDSLSQALITVFKESFWRAREELKKSNAQTNAQFDPQLLDATDVRLDNAYLVRADLAEAWLMQASLREAQLSDAQLQGANLGVAEFKGATLRGARLEEADLGGAQLQGANLFCAQLQGANLSEAQLQGANLSWAQLEEADLEGANLEGATLFLTRLKGADLERAQLQGASLRGAQFKDADLSDAQLEGANLTETNPEDAASLKDTKMNGVIGLTPEQREMCINKGAIFDDVEQEPASATSSSSSLPSEQGDDTPVPPAPSVQVSTPPPDIDGSSATSSSKPDPKS